MSSASHASSRTEHLDDARSGAHAATVQPMVAADRRGAVAGVGAQLRERRKAAGLSLRQFAKMLGVSASFISQIENGKSQPSVGTLYLICNTLDVTVDELLTEAGGTTKPTDQPPEPRPEQRPPAALGRANDLTGALESLSSARSDSDSPLVTRSRRRRLVLDTGVTWEQLSSTHERAIDFMFITYDVGGSSTVDERLTRHSGIEYGYIISGELEVTLGFETYRLGPGDAISFDSSTPHRLYNKGDVPVEAVWFVHRREGRHEHDL